MARVFNYKTNPDYVEYKKNEKTKNYVGIPKTSKSTYVSIVKSSDLYRHMVNQKGTIKDVGFYVETVEGSPKKFKVKCTVVNLNDSEQSKIYELSQGYNNFDDVFGIDKGARISIDYVGTIVENKVKGLWVTYNFCTDKNDLDKVTE